MARPPYRGGELVHGMLNLGGGPCLAEGRISACERTPDRFCNWCQVVDEANPGTAPQHLELCDCHCHEPQPVEWTVVVAFDVDGRRFEKTYLNVNSRGESDYLSRAPIPTL